MMDKKEELKKYINSQLLNGRGPATLSDQDELLLSGIIDSMGMLQLVNFIEEKFGCQVPFEDFTIENFETIAAMDTYLQTLA